MTNNSSSTREVTANNIFDINRLGLSDTFEAGKSVTLGLDYKLDIKTKMILTIIILMKKIGLLNLNLQP